MGLLRFAQTWSPEEREKTKAAFVPSSYTGRQGHHGLISRLKNSTGYLTIYYWLALLVQLRRGGGEYFERQGLRAVAFSP